MFDRLRGWWWGRRLKTKRRRTHYGHREVARRGARKAIGVLATLNDARSVKILMAARFKASAYYGSHGGSPFDAFGNELDAAFRQLRGNRVVNALIEGLKEYGVVEGLNSGANLAVLRNCIEALGRLGDTRAVEPLIELLPRANSGLIDSAVAEALGALGDRRALQPLIKLMKERSCKEAIEALGALGSTQAVEPLIEHLNEPGRTEAVAAALAMLGDPRAIQPLESALSRETYPPIREAIAAALKKLRS